jgi:hypothetical protein
MRQISRSRAGHRRGAAGDRSASLPPSPRVMIYNVLARSTAHYRALIGDASELVMNLASRDLGSRQVTTTAAE